MRKFPGSGTLCTRCTIEAPCKINLHLRVKDRRPDGFHDLESVFLALSFGDTLRFEVLGEGTSCEIRMNMALPDGEKAPGEEIKPEQNLVYRAVSLFREKTGFNRALRVRLEKRIPLGGGFGGGSSDAAAALRALDLLAGTGLSRKALGEMAQVLGSDVPFFLDGGAALVTGRGERLQTLPVPQGIAVVLVHPGFPSPTAGAFALLDTIRKDRKDRKESVEPLSPGLSLEEFQGLLKKDPGDWPFDNDFLPVFLTAGEKRVSRAYRDILGDLTQLEADFSGLSGAGSGCFGIFVDGGMAEKAAKELSCRWQFVQLTFPLAY